MYPLKTFFRFSQVNVFLLHAHAVYGVKIHLNKTVHVYVFTLQYLIHIIIEMYLCPQIQTKEQLMVHCAKFTVLNNLKAFFVKRAKISGSGVIGRNCFWANVYFRRSSIEELHFRGKNRFTRLLRCQNIRNNSSIIYYIYLSVQSEVVLENTQHITILSLSLERNNISSSWLVPCCVICFLVNTYRPIWDRVD